MSDRRIASVCLVIDPSIARAAGGFDSEHPTGMMCRDVLIRVLGICHRMAFGERIKEDPSGGDVKRIRRARHLHASPSTLLAPSLQKAAARSR